MRWQVGLGLVAASTFVIAAEHAMLGTPEIDASLFPMMLVSLLERLVPRRRLNRMMFLNEPMTAAEAAEVGLIDRDVAPVHLDEVVDALVHKISSKSRTAVAHGLRALYAQEELPARDLAPPAGRPAGSAPRHRRRPRAFLVPSGHGRDSCKLPA